VDRDLIESAANSLVIAVFATILATFIGTLAAYGLWKKTPSRQGRWLHSGLSGSFYLSLVTPEIVTGVSLLVFFEWLFRFLHMRLGMHTVIVAHVAFSVAYVVIVVMARLRSFDPVLEEAALDLGATEYVVFTKVTLPYLAPRLPPRRCWRLRFPSTITSSPAWSPGSIRKPPMVIYAMARRGVNPVLNAVSTIVVVALGTMVVLSERMRSA